MYLTERLATNERLVINEKWIEDYILPAITTGTGTKKVHIGFKNLLNPDWTNGISSLDFAVSYQFYCDDTLRANDQWRLGYAYTGVTDLTYIGNKASADFDYVFINTNRADGGVKIGALLESQGHNPSTLLYSSSSPWDKRANKNNNGFGGYPENTDKAIFIAAVNAQLTLTNNSDIFEVFRACRWHANLLLSRNIN